MRILIGAVGLALLVGCASMNEKRADGPARTFSSKQAADEVAECVLVAWQNQSLAGAHYDVSLQPLPGGGKTVVSAGQIEFADFKSTENGSRVELYFQTGLMDWRKNRRIEAVTTCL
ncbi:hypothetical protein K8374_12815 [Pseudomonas sp. p1(2021b)]|uniref:hypothetical protein n=1 Tax=Pseudomonas sp. p1(2021b) TaxID=2874628 RepID=UPI001CCE7679|nr:hypothetical protein [Pseudomonas sp. p1(2021b)]UBM23285.1 hypothetical protein K8374_12815 [Pseudomonas sp. p1(2021b)]